MRKAATRIATWSVAVAIATATRAPGRSTEMTILAVGGGGLLIGLAAFAHWRKAPSMTKAWTFVASLAFLLLPPSPDAALAWLPAWAAAILVVLAMHILFQDATRRAPVVASGHQWGRNHALRFLPAALALAVLLAIPLAYRFLPLRIKAAYELQTALAPLLPLALLGSVLLFAGALRAIIGHRLATGSHEIEPTQEVETA